MAFRNTFALFLFLKSIFFALARISGLVFYSKPLVNGAAIYSSQQKIRFICYLLTYLIGHNKKSPLSSRQCVGLLDEKPVFESQVRHQNEIRKVFLRRFPLSRFLAKTLRKKIKLPRKVSQKICRSESTLNCRSRHLCIKLTHTT